MAVYRRDQCEVGQEFGAWLVGEARMRGRGFN